MRVQCFNAFKNERDETDSDALHPHTFETELRERMPRTKIALALDQPRVSPIFAEKKRGQLAKND